MMTLGHLELFVSDPLQSMVFYRDVLGFTVNAIQEQQFVWLQSGSHELLLRPGLRANTPATYGRSRLALVIYTNTMANSLQTLHTHGITPQPMLNSPGCYTFTDPDGNWLQLVDPTTH